MTETSLLAYLAPRLTSQTELLATEALGYILSRSDASMQALKKSVEWDGDTQIERVRTEVTGEGGDRVDLACFDGQGNERVLIEAKFWAGLTDNQPNAYLDRLLQVKGPTVLLFVAPAKRLETLWPKLRGNHELGEDEHRGGTRGAVAAGSECRLMLTSWRSLLDALRTSARNAGDAAVERDILQLGALCNAQDASAFLPLRAEEFAPSIPRRLLNLQKLIDDAVARGRDEGIVDTTKRNVTPLATGYGRYLRIGGGDTWAEARLEVNYERWAEQKEIPLWFVLAGSPEMPLADIERRLGRRLFHFDLPVGVEYDAVLGQVMTYLEGIAEKIRGEEAR